MLELGQVVMLLLLLGSCLFAAIAGGWPERAAAGILFGGGVITWTAQGIAGTTPELAFLLIDVGMAAGLLLVLLRSKLFWAGAACCAQMLMLAFTATRFFNFPLSEVGYVAMLQISSIILAGSLIYGTWSRRWGAPDADLQTI